MECARNLLNLLFEGGAAQAIGVNVGKYGRQRYVIIPEALYTSNAYDPVNHSDSSFEEQISLGMENREVQSRGFEPLTSAVQRRHILCWTFLALAKSKSAYFLYNAFPELSGY